jgi:hypothetical protein
MYVLRNTEARSRNRCCRGKAVLYILRQRETERVCVCVCVVLVIQHAKRMRRVIVSCGLSGCTTFFDNISSGTIIGKKVIEHKICFDFLYNFAWSTSHSENSARYCHKCKNVFMLSTRYSCHILIKLEFSGQIFRRKLKSIENSSSGSRVVPCRHDETNNRFSPILRTRLKILRFAHTVYLCVSYGSQTKSDYFTVQH